MRKIFIFFFILSTIHQLLIGQTNNYPTTGDVTIFNYSPNLILQRNTTDGGFTEGIQTRLQDGTDNWYFGALHTGQWVVSKGNYANRKMTILENGNVGIGVTDPQAKLDINGDIRIGSNLLLGNWQLNNNSWPGSGGFTYGGGDVIFGLHSNGGQASLQIDGAFIQAEAGKTNTYAGSSQFNNTLNFPGSGIWNASGNVGIGNTNPQSPLHIKASTGYGSIRISPIADNAESSMGFFSDANGSSNSTAWVIGNSAWGNTGKFIIGNQTAGGPIIIAQQNGNVGIGTTTPSAKLDIESSILFSYGTPTYGVGIKSTGVGGGGWARRYGFMKSSDNSLFGGFGAFGDENSLSYYWVGSDYNTPSMIWNASGNVGVGTTNPAYKLDVLGTIRAKEVLVNLDGGADFVFEKDYKLPTIEHVATYVQENKHLPDVPSANEMVKNGVSMGDMQVKLLQKVEELTLYAIQQNKEIVEQRKDRKELEAKLAKQECQYNALLTKVETLSKQIEKR